MWRRGSVWLPIMFFGLPVVRGLHTLAKAAASWLGICVQAGVGGAVLDCSGTTDPGVEESIDEQGQRADDVSLTNLSWVEATFEVPGPRVDCVSLANLSEGWTRGVGKEGRRANIGSLASLSWASAVGFVEMHVGGRGA